MVKPKEEAITQFNEVVNMTVEELEEWLENPQSEKAGTGVGIESGHKILEILRKNPTKDPGKYDDEDIDHIRKVVGYANRHLAQEDHLRETKTREELENTKSTISLKNWGHDPVKVLDKETAEASEPEAEPVEPSDPTSTGDDEPQESHTDAFPEEVTEENEEVEGEDAKKRKLGAGKADATSRADEQPEDDDVESGVDEIDDQEQERPRKRSKINNGTS